ncbi:MAG: 1-acyl-sn-glycerol-3-phosphate acyltransferase [Myxococcales bacterium]|nr:1-acyl-sn-glycerol-3-phosphate acyltransferase [Myxococcales bacterium]
MIYAALRWFLGLAMRVFFRQVEVVGLEHVPATGPVIFAGNHPNSLIDPILIITTCGRRVRFAAKDTLFSTRIMRALLGALGAVPLKRKDDHGAATGGLDNDAAFAAMFDALAAGDTIGIFPEGLSHDASQLARLKTGAARLALGAARRGAPVVVVPCGLTFVHPKRFRSRVLVQYGPPITIAAPAAAEADAPDAARALTARLEASLRSLTINASDWDTVRALDTVRRLYQPPAIELDQRIELARRFNAHYPAVRDQPEVRAVIARSQAYQARLDELGVSDRELARGLDAGAAAGRVLRTLGFLLVWIPIMLPAAPLHLPAVLLARVAGKRLTPRKDVIATTKVLAGILIVLAFYAAAAVVVAWRFGPLVALAVGAYLPIAGFATLRVLDRVAQLRRGVGALARALTVGRQARRLAGERAALVDEIVRVVALVRPPELVLMFPREGA